MVRPGPGGAVGPVGVLALQGDFREHLSLLASLGVAAMPVRLPSQLEQVGALVVPGGESTTISLLLESSGLLGPLRERLRLGMPALGTCAGMILLAEEVLDGRPDQHCLGAIDISVRRNAFGRQRESFEADLLVDGLSAPLHAVFIRAPVVERVGDGVEVLSSVILPDGAEKPVVCRQGNVLVCSFHPELAGDPRLHEAFLGLVPPKQSTEQRSTEQRSAEEEGPNKEGPNREGPHREGPNRERTGNVRAL